MATNFPTSVDNFTNPTANDSLNLPSHSTQHANANDAIESIESVLVPAVNAWTAYTPTFTNFTLGNGTIGFAYALLGKIVLVRGGITLGTTSSVTGNMRFSLPVTAIGSAGNSIIGNSRYSDIGVQSYLGVVELYSTTVGALILPNVAGTYPTPVAVSNTIPFTWATGDDIRLYLTYQGL